MEAIYSPKEKLHPRGEGNGVRQGSKKDFLKQDQKGE